MAYHPTRRRFLKSAAAAGAGLLVVRPAFLRAGESPNAKINVACIGVGGRGAANLSGVAGESVVALCDVDANRLAEAARQFPAAKTYRDFRKMLDEMTKGIDAVVVSTPDHTHAVAVLVAIARGKHVYCEKPLAHSIGEVRAIVKAARQRKVVTQLGNQGHSSDTIRMFCEWIADGAIGAVHTIHAGCGMVYSKLHELGLVKEQHPVPAWLDWDLWLGPAEARPYHPAYLPGSWRGWMPFGTGCIGDWTCHVVDPVFWALDLGSPATVHATADGYDPKTHSDTFPRGTTVRFTFPARNKRGPVTLFWYDGEAKLPRPPELEPERKVPEIGAIVLGDKGGITYGSHGAGGLRIFPEAKMKSYALPPKTIPRVKGHHQDWLQAIRNGGKAGSDFSYGGPLTEIALLGVIATRLLGRELKWDGQAGRFTNCPEANALVAPPWRKGWTV